MREILIGPKFARKRIIIVERLIACRILQNTFANIRICIDIFHVYGHSCVNSACRPLFHLCLHCSNSSFPHHLKNCITEPYIMFFKALIFAHCRLPGPAVITGRVDQHLPLGAIKSFIPGGYAQICPPHLFFFPALIMKTFPQTY